uniref:t-SNARE coiled-coil homology domain-containing protein n=1 Tax=Panagrellus redivivus TaxID=6233 RepID=A0A7E4WA25_PANRE
MKDRLEEFQLRAEEFGSNRRYTDDSDAGPSYAERDALLVDPAADWSEMETFLHPVREVENQITTLTALLEQIQAIHREMLISPGIHPDVTKRWAGMIDDFLATSKSVNNRIKGLTEIANRLDESPAHKRIKQNHLMILNRSIRAVLFRFHTERDWYRDKCKTSMRRYNDIVDVKLTEEEMDEAIDNGQIFSMKSQMMGDRERRLLYDDVQNRHKELQKLEASITELHEMFQDLYMLVDSQGDVLNNIETNISNAAEYAHQANRNVVQARAARQRNIKLKIFGCICGVILVFILVFMLAGTFCFYLPFVCR